MKTKILILCVLCVLCGLISGCKSSQPALPPDQHKLTDQRFEIPRGSQIIIPGVEGVIVTVENGYFMSGWYIINVIGMELE